MVTMKKVAEHAGVSIATVSAVINGARWVTEKTRDRVLQSVEATGYRPNGLARGLKTRQSNAIGVIVSDLTNPFFTQIVRTLGRALRAHERNLFLCDAEQSYELGALHYEMLLEKRVDGLVVIGASVSRTLLESSIPAVPVVAIERDYRLRGVSSLLVDSEQGAYDATMHLVEGGYERIAIINGPAAGPGSESFATGRLLEGYRRALERAGMTYDPSYFVRGDFHYASGAAALRKLLACSPRPDAVFVANDLMALGVMHEARLSRLRIPDDLAVIGYDDIPMAELVAPSLSSLSMPNKELGQEAAALLDRRLKDSALIPPTQQMFSARLIVRESSVRASAARATVTKQSTVKGASLQ